MIEFWILKETQFKKIFNVILFELNNAPYAKPNRQKTDFLFSFKSANVNRLLLYLKKCVPTVLRYPVTHNTVSNWIKSTKGVWKKDLQFLNYSHFKIEPTFCYWVSLAEQIVVGPYVCQWNILKSKNSYKTHEFIVTIAYNFGTKYIVTKFLTNNKP